MEMEYFGILHRIGQVCDIKLIETLRTSVTKHHTTITIGHVEDSKTIYFQIITHCKFMCIR